MSSLINYLTWKRARAEGEDETKFDDIRGISSDQQNQSNRSNEGENQNPTFDGHEGDPHFTKTNNSGRQSILKTRRNQTDDNTMIHEDQFRKEGEIM